MESSSLSIGGKKSAFPIIGPPLPAKTFSTITNKRRITIPPLQFDKLWFTGLPAEFTITNYKL